VIVREFKKKSALLFGILFYFITLSIYLHVIQVGPDYMGERFLFIPSLGFIIAIIALIERITKASFDSNAKSILKNRKARIAFGIIGLFFVMGFVKTTSRSKAWENNKVLLETDIVVLDDCARTQYNYACLLHNEYYNQPSESKQEKILYHYRRAVEISDRSMKAMLDLGNVYMEFGQMERGKAVFEKAIKAHEGLAAPLMQLGKYYISKNQFAEALIQYEKIEENTKLPVVYHSKAICFLKMNKIEEAILSMEEGEKYGPNSADYFVLLSDLYVAQGSNVKAKKAIKKAIKIAPEDDSIKLKASLIK
jgi:tetratricopeptide (TPR) repeat protein